MLICENLQYSTNASSKIVVIVVVILIVSNTSNKKGNNVKQHNENHCKYEKTLGIIPVLLYVSGSHNIVKHRAICFDVHDKKCGGHN